jgi:uncharacterized protein YndB with AHSA1/START domain
MSETMTMKAKLAAPIGEVHKALTDAGALRRWLAEHAEVDLPHRYAFWGRYTPEGLAPDAAQRQRPLQVDERTVRFSWLIGGEDSTVEIRLAEDGPDATVIDLAQTNVASWEEAVAEDSVRGWLLTFWSLALANLIDHLEGRELTPKADFGTPEMRAQVMIDAPRDRVFESMIDAEQFSRWFGAKVAIEPHVGGRFAMAASIWTQTSFRPVPTGTGEDPRTGAGPQGDAGLERHGRRLGAGGLGRQDPADVHPEWLR